MSKEKISWEIIYTQHNNKKRFYSLGRTRELTQEEILKKKDIEIAYFKLKIKLLNVYIKDEIEYRTCTTLEEIKSIRCKYMNYYNNDRYQWN